MMGRRWRWDPGAGWHRWVGGPNTREDWLWIAVCVSVGLDVLQLALELGARH